MNTKMAARFNFLLILVILLSSCVAGKPQAVPVAPVTGLPQGTDGFAWWNDTTFYEIFVRSFYDSNADGIGDFNGLIQKLDYLNDGDPNTTTDLGVTGIWLMPIFPSPSYHGYDVTDYYNVNPDYGTLDDFKRLLDEAHKRGIRVIIDMVLNHTSVKNPWFQASQDPNSPFRDWYIWSENDPGYAGPWGEKAWHKAPGGGYYYAAFGEGMPDLNYNNPDVTAKMEDVIRFWLKDVKVDGFRLDGARYLVEAGREQADTQLTHTWFENFRYFYKELDPNAVTVGEVWTTSYTVASYLQGDQLDLAFNFDLATGLLRGAKYGQANYALDQLVSDLKVFQPNQYATFLTNHDINRTMSQLGGNSTKAKNAATLLLTAPGVPFIYYGEEIGMAGRKPDEQIRTPMQWTAEEDAGFTTGLPWENINEDYLQINVADKSSDAESLLSTYKNLIRLRNQHAALRVGDAVRVDGSDPAIYSLLRTSKDERILILSNLGNKPLSDYNLSLEAGDLSGSYRVFSLFGEDTFPDLVANTQGGFNSYQPVPTLPVGSPLLMQLQPVQ